MDNLENLPNEELDKRLHEALGLGCWCGLARHGPR